MRSSFDRNNGYLYPLMNFAKVKGLLDLLDDPDENIYEQIASEITTLGTDVIPFLENFWEESENPLAIERAQLLIDKISNNVNIEQLSTWVNLGGKKLLKGAVLVAKCLYYNLDEEDINRQLDKIKQDIWIELNDNLTALEKIAVVNRVLFDFHSFEGNREDYYSHKNSFINKVLDQKTGTPLSIGIIYAVICQDLDIPVYGVNLPHHFILAYKDEDMFPIMDESMAEPGILFYINPFNRGSIFGKPEVKEFLEQNNVPPEKHYFQPCPNVDIIKRMINNIIVAFQKEEKFEKAERFKKLLKVFK